MTIRSEFDQLSPLVDDVMMQLARLPINARKRAAIAWKIAMRTSVAAQKIMIAALHSGEPLDKETAKAVARDITETSEQAAEEIEACHLAHTEAGRMQ